MYQFSKTAQQRSRQQGVQSIHGATEQTQQAQRLLQPQQQHIQLQLPMVTVAPQPLM